MFLIIYLLLGYGKEQANSQQHRIDHLVILSLKNHHINVSIVYPGFIKTAMSDRINSPKPLMISAKKAALIIQKKIAQNKSDEKEIENIVLN